jgi:hypothetical protein
VTKKQRLLGQLLSAQGNYDRASSPPTQELGHKFQMLGMEEHGDA